VTRCGNLFGGGDQNWNRIVPGTIRSIIRGERPTIRSDGQFVRDYIYVRDAAGAIMHLVERMAIDPDKVVGECFNFSNEIQLTVMDLVSMILGIMECPLLPDIRNDAVNEIRHQYLSAEKARRLLEWSPRYTLEQGLHETVAWYRQYFS